VFYPIHTVRKSNSQGTQISKHGNSAPLSVAMAIANVFSNNGISVGRNLAKILRR
jgi:hypothetical protein